MSPLPRLAAPRGPSQRIAAMVARAPAAPAEQLADPGTVNLLGDLLEQGQKQAWMVTAHLDPGGP